jgi:hypothetical protein
MFKFLIKIVSKKKVNLDNWFKLNFVKKKLFLIFVVLLIILLVENEIFFICFCLYGVKFL